MKKYTYLILAAWTAALAACENGSQEFPDYDYRTVYFAYQSPVRTLVLGEDPESDNTKDNAHQCEIKAVTGGGYSNLGNIVIRFTVDNTMTDDLYFKGTNQRVYPMPPTYYKLSSDQIEIPQGKNRGGVTVEFTQDFFNDSHAIENCYVIPLRMTHVSGADSILRGQSALANPNRFVESDWDVQPRDYVLYCVKYINPWHATYLRRGVDTFVGKSGHESLSKTEVRHGTYVENDEVVQLTTSAYRAVKMTLNAKDEAGTNIPYTVVLTFDEAGNCTVSSAEPKSYQISGTGKFVEKGDKNSWGNKDRNAIFLDYTVDLPQLTCHTVDTLVVRNRGVVLETFIPETK